MAQKPVSKVVPFRPRHELEDEEELPVGLPPSVALASHSEQSVSSVDLNGKPKVWFAIGSGRTGKSLVLRWAFETAAEKGGTAIPAAADPQNRSLKHYIENVAEPPTNDAAATARWLEQLLRHVMTEKTSALVDLGGGDTALGKLLVSMPDLAMIMEGEGVTPVAIYMLGPRVDDMAALASFEAAGFRPAATALVLNEGLADPTAPREESFARVLRHSALKGAVNRGAVRLWMPRLEPAVSQHIESNRLHFAQARDAVSPEGRKVAPLGPFDRARVSRWLKEMSSEFSPIMSWLP